MGRKPEVHQFLPSFNLPDAVGYHTLRTKEDLLRAGYRGAIWGEEVRGDLKNIARYYSGYERVRSARKHGNLLLYQASTGSRGLVDFLLERTEPLTLCYHNITPHNFFEPFDPGSTVSLKRGRDELMALAKRMRIALACSAFNAAELREWGIEDVRIVPPYLTTPQTDPDPAFRDRLLQGKRGIDLLFVGRVVPNKGHLHLLRTFAALRAQDPGARLFIAGGWGPEAYMRTLFRFRDKIGIDKGCMFTGRIPDEHLTTLYQECDLFLSLSEHEGFGLPLIEAMRAGLPVVAYAAGGTPETMGGAGILLNTLDPTFVSEVILRIASEDLLRQEIIDRQKARAAEVEAVPRGKIIVEAVDAILNG